MASNRNAFVTYTELPSKKFVYLGDDSRQLILGKGNVFISLDDGQERLVPEVLQVPSLHKNLFSIHQLVQQGGSLLIEPD